MSRASLFVALFLFGILWGGTIPLTKTAVSSGHHPVGLIFWQMALGVVGLGTMLVVKGHRIPVSVDHMVFYTIIAVVGTIIPNGFSYFTAFHLPGGVMALVIALVPMFSLLIALLFRLERFQAARAAGVILGAMAIGLIVLPETSLPDPSKAIFVILALIAPLFYGIEGNYLSVSRFGGTHPAITLFGASLVGAIITFPVSFFVGGFISPRSGIGAPELALIGSTALHLIAYGGYIWLIRKAGAVFSAQVAYIVTPAGIIFSMIFLGESQSGWLWLSLVVLMIGLTLVQPRSGTVATA